MCLSIACNNHPPESLLGCFSHSQGDFFTRLSLLSGLIVPLLKLQVKNSITWKRRLTDVFCTPRVELASNSSACLRIEPFFREPARDGGKVHRDLATAGQVNQLLFARVRQAVARAGPSVPGRPGSQIYFRGIGTCLPHGCSRRQNRFHIPYGTLHDSHDSIGPCEIEWVHVNRVLPAHEALPDPHMIRPLLVGPRHSSVGRNGVWHIFGGCVRIPRSTWGGQDVVVAFLRAPRAEKALSCQSSSLAQSSSPSPLLRPLFQFLAQLRIEFVEVDRPIDRSRVSFGRLVPL